MTKIRAAFVLTLVLTAGATAGYAYTHRSPGTGPSLAVAPPASAAEATVLYYRDPTGAPFWSATPKTDAQGRAYLPVTDDAEPSFDPPHSRPALSLPPLGQLKAVQGERKVRFYRNPMGLPDTSPVPKKDTMGMDYIAVYDDDDSGDSKTIKVSLDRVQRSGVRTEPVKARVLERAVRAVGTVAIDESRQTVVTMRSDGYVEDLFVDKTGQTVQAGQPLFRVYSQDIQQALAELMVVTGHGQATQTQDHFRIDGTMRRLRNLGVPESVIREVRERGVDPHAIDWPAPATGTVVNKRIVNGQQAKAGDELYRIVDLSHVWVIADVAERYLADIKMGTRATVTFRAYRNQPVEGVVSFIYPDVRTETRTVRVRIEVPNPDGRLKTDMYADVVFHADTGAGPVVTVPTGAVIDDGAQQIVLVAKSEGRFEPRPVKLGRRGDGHVEIVAGLKQGEEIVTTATFLIDAESNLQTALKTFSEKEPVK
jgi:Cu(I)/Ag(I) efflux system membrane fusion protein